MVFLVAVPHNFAGAAEAKGGFGCVCGFAKVAVGGEDVWKHGNRKKEKSAFIVISIDAES